MPPSDTAPTAYAIQLAAYRRMTGGERVSLAFEMSLLAREFALAGLRRDLPGLTEAELLREFLRRQFPTDRIPRPLQ